MFYPFQKNFLPYYLGLIFIAFPLLGLKYFGYPLWTAPLTLLFVVCYLGTIHLKAGYEWLKEVFWYYILAYIVLITCLVNGNMMWFFFYPSNLMVWEYGKDWQSYRGMTLLIAVGLVFGFGVYSAHEMTDKIAIGLITLFMLGMATFQIKLREDDILKEELYQKSQENQILAAENERNRIGRDLHDTLGHTFAMMTLKTELALKQLEKNQLEAVQKELEELHTISQDSMKEVRSLINHLKYRTVSEELSNIEEMFALSEVALTVKCEIETEALSPVLQSSMTMILRELTTNVIKHADANSCTIRLFRHEGIVIEVTDDGDGFKELTGHELHSIKERLQLVDGEVVIVSPLKPTIVQVTLQEGEEVL